jgi:hypothetical protein
MRVSFVVLLVLGFCSAVPCSYGQARPAAQANSAATADAPRHSKRYTSQLGPAPNLRQVKLEQIIQKPAYYAATLPVLRDKDGQISLSVIVNPKTHSIQKLKLLFVPLDKAVTYNQVIEGISLYDAPTGRYYFNTLYQKVRQLPAGVTEHGSSRQIRGWVEPSTSRAAVTEAPTPHQANENGSRSFFGPAK